MNTTLRLLLLLLIVLLAVWGINSSVSKEKQGDKEKVMEINSDEYQTATFAGGCFWCMQPPFDRLEGVVKTNVGYSGGTEMNPKYEEVASGRTSHAEAIQIVFDPEKIRYEKLLETFWINIDPTQEDGQFADSGRQYRTAIFYHDDEQKKLAEESKKSLAESGKFNKPLVTLIEPFKSFYEAEEYHQKYYEKNPIHYNMYKKGSGREGFIKKTWAK